MRVLVVDDDDEIRSVVSEVLTDRGHSVVVVGSAEAAWERCQREPFSLMVVDWMLPGADGLELCRRVRATHQGDASVILVMTARSGAENLSAVLASGANDYIAKPFDLGMLDVRLAVAERNVAENLERQRMEAELEHQALHDALTGLPNRVLLNDRLSHAILTARRSHTPLALLMLDLDHFKEANDTFGHLVGDQILRQLGSRLGSALRHSDTVARLGGDEFAVLLPGSDEEGAILAAGKLLGNLEVPLQIEQQHHDVRASIGIALFPAHGDDAESLLRRADIAMYVAKRTRLGMAVYSPDVDDYSPARYAMRGELRTAIDQGQLVLHYQPKIDFQSGSIARVEALVRWQHPKQGLLLPERFINLAEQTGLIDPLSRWVLDAALAQCHRWHAAGLTIPVAVNLSMHNLHNTELPDLIAALLAKWQVVPQWLIVEVTETAVVGDLQRTADVLRRISAMGVQIAVDDFGTGYSSLSYLNRLPVSQIKIDKSFVGSMARQKHNLAIVRSTIELGHQLGLEVLAEGVEDKATLDLLLALGCDGAQGYLFGQPLPPDELKRWVEANQHVFRKAIDASLPVRQVS
jgi:diguanylate cyclase (GGDEF)-like protein